MFGIREADQEDMEDIRAWRNDPLSRSMSGETAEVSRATHEEWFRAVLGAEGRLMLMIERDGTKGCMVRFDEIVPGEFDVSINMNPSWRGRGLSKQVLRESIEFLRTRWRVLNLRATVKGSNIPSHKCFLANGFSLTKTETEFKIYEKKYDGG